MIRVMFVCLGNICRSPMAEFVFRKMVEDRGVGDNFFISSAGTSSEEYGNPVYPPAKRELKKHGIVCDGKRAVQLKEEDFEKYDYFLCMDKSNLRAMNRIFGRSQKQYLLLSFTEKQGEVADPWYTGDFVTTYQDIVDGCEAFLRFLQEKN